MSSQLAVIGATALYLTYAWLASAIVASYVSNLKGYGEKPGLASGLLLNAAGVLVWLVWPPRPEAAERGGLHTKWGAVRVIVFTVLSGGIYVFYWFSITRKQVNEELGVERNTTLETIGLAIPIVSLLVSYRLWTDISALRARHDLPPLPHVRYLVLSIFPILNLVAFGLVVRDLDQYWDATGRGATRMGVTLWEGLLVAAGMVLLVLVLALAL